MPAVSLARLEAQFSTPERETAVLEGSCLRGGTYRDWYAQRNFIAQFINKSGTLLDIGCANGLLLLSLMAWAEHDITPYGIDADQSMVQAARELLPESRGHIAQLQHGRLHELPALGLPDAFDFVYWNVWDDIDFGQDWHHAFAEQAFAAAAHGGRVALGFYDHDKEAIERKLEWLQERFGLPDGRATSNSGGEVLAWWQR